MVLVCVRLMKLCAVPDPDPNKRVIRTNSQVMSLGPVDALETSSDRHIV